MRITFTFFFGFFFTGLGCAIAFFFLGALSFGLASFPPAADAFLIFFDSVSGAPCRVTISLRRISTKDSVLTAKEASGGGTSGETEGPISLVVR